MTDSAKRPACNKKLRVILLVAAVYGGFASADDDNGHFADITGQVVLSEALSKLPPVIKSGAPVKDAQVCSAHELPDERLVADDATLGVKNVLVWLSKPKVPAAMKEKWKSQKLEPVSWTFDGCRLVPHVQCVRTGQEFHMVNKDRIPHIPHDFPMRNTAGCQGLPAHSPQNDYVYKQRYHRAESQPIKFSCDYHAWIRGYMLVQDHPWMAITDENGKFELSDVPVGQQRLVVWHELRGYLFREEIDVQSPAAVVNKIVYKLTNDEKKKLGIVEP